jgi:hypothetical protein
VRKLLKYVDYLSAFVDIEIFSLYHAPAILSQDRAFVLSHGNGFNTRSGLDDYVDGEARITELVNGSHHLAELRAIPHYSGPLGEADRNRPAGFCFSPHPSG